MSIVIEKLKKFKLNKKNNKNTICKGKNDHYLHRYGIPPEYDSLVV